MTINTNALVAKATPQNTMDIEAQTPETPQYNRNLARVKIAVLAAANIASALTTALAVMDEGSEGESLHGRGLLNEGCSPQQLNKISNLKRALVVSGITSGALFGGSLLGRCLMSTCSEPGEESRSFGWMIRQACATGFGLSGTATMISGIMYGRAKGKC